MRAILPSDTFPWYPENLYDRLIISQIEGNSRIYRITKILSSPISYDLLDVFMIPSNITREHILQALQEINMRGVPSSREPTKFALVWNGKLYPPKYTISLANKYPNREELDPSAFSGGDETNPFLTKLDFPIINITKWKEITGILKQIYDTRSKNENLQNIINSKNEVLSKYQPVFSPEHIPYLKAEEFSDFLYFGNNKHWSGLHRQKETITQDMEGLKSALLILVDESLPVRDRLDRIRPKGGKSLVKGIGEAISTAILQVIGPDKYGVWNTTSKKGLEKAGIFPLIKKDASFGEQYVALNEVLIALSRAINVDLWTLDALLYEYATRDGEKSEQDKEDVLLPDENGSFLINAVNDTISIAETIVREGLDNKKISQTVDADVYNEKYNKIIKPLISNFNEKYGNTPNLLLKDIVSEFASKNHLSEDFEIHSFPFYGQKVNSYVWAAITKKTINYKDRKASHFPQLYVLINAYSIRFGVTYGNHVKSDDPMVNIFRSDRELQVIVKNLLRNNLTIQVYKEKSPNSLLPKDALLTNILLQDNFEEWTNETNILENHPKDKIPDNLKDRIITVFTLLFPLFELATYADDYQKIPELKAKYRFDKTNSLNTWNLVKEKIGYSLSNFDFSLKNLYFEADEETRIKRQILAALKSGKHIILIGPPGTGKSKLAQEICNKLVGPTNYQMATASSDWSTYETIGGYRPD